MSYTQILVHIVLIVEDRTPCLVGTERLKLYDTISDVVQNNECRLHRINAVGEHLHLLCDLHPSVNLEDLIDGIRKASETLIKKENMFPQFKGWQAEYAAFTCSHKDKASIAKYIERQQEFHRTVSFADEFEEMLKAASVKYNPKCL